MFDTDSLDDAHLKDGRIAIVLDDQHNSVLYVVRQWTTDSGMVCGKTPDNFIVRYPMHKVAVIVEAI